MQTLQNLQLGAALLLVVAIPIGAYIIFSGWNNHKKRG
mgnify:CR=1 FL=1